jgi:predicted phage tail component-like protein
MLSIDGVHIENDLGLHLLADSDETMMPDTRQDTLTVPGKHGVYVFDSYLEPRRFFPYILIPSQATLNDVQGIVRKVASLLVDEYGKPKDVKLIYDYEPDKYYIARFTGYIAIDRVAKTGRFPIPFLAYDPMAKLIMESHEIDWDSDLPIDADVLIDTGLGVHAITSPVTLDIVNSGTNTLRFSYRLEGSGTDVTISANGKSFSLGAFSNTKWEVDGEKYSVLKNGAYNMPDTNFIELKPGNNDVTITGTNLNLTLTENVRYQYV